MPESRRLRFGPYTVTTGNEDKPFFPDAGITKGDVIDHYLAIAGVMLPHLKDRPLTMQRFPDGIGGEGFFQKNRPSWFPDWIGSVEVETGDGAQVQVVCGNKASLAYIADQACLTPHIWLSRRGALDRPDRMVIDLDPSGDDFEPVRRAGHRVHAMLHELGLTCGVMTTGSRGLHVVVPLDGSESFDRVREFARAFAGELARRHPDSLTTEQRVDERGGRLYLDTGRNAYGQTGVAPYAVRARPGAPVAAPLDWAELADGDLDASRWTLRNVRRRLAQRPCPWKGIGRHAQSLGRARAALRAVACG